MAYGEAERTVQPPKKPNDLTLQNRRKLTVSGVEQVERFDVSEISMRTGEGSLVVRGEDLHISRLSVEGGDVNITGLITEIRYEETQPERGFWARLFG